MMHGKNLLAVRNDMRKKGEETIQLLKRNSNHDGIVLAGRPYHIDPEVNHGIPELINSYDMAVLTEDSISHLNSCRTTIKCIWISGCIILDLYAAANYVKTSR